MGTAHRLAAMLGLVPYVEAATDPSPAGVGTVGTAPSLAPFTVPNVTMIDKATALTVPTLQRAHDLIVSLVSGLPIVPYRERWDTDTSRLTVELVAPLPWHVRPDPIVTRQAWLGSLASDLWAYGRAYVRITGRYADTKLPATFRHMRFEYTTINPPADADPALSFPPGSEVRYAGAVVAYADVIELRSPTIGVCEAGWDAIAIALALNTAAKRFSTVEMPSGWLQQIDGEPMDAEQLSDLAGGWTESRRNNTTGALNQLVKFEESSFDPGRLQLVESRQYQSLELARVGNVPPYLVGAPTGTGMTYQNAQQARSDLVDFGAAPIISAIAQGMSGPAVSPAGQGVHLDTAEWLAGNPYEQTTPARPAPVGRPPVEVPA